MRWEQRRASYGLCGRKGHQSGRPPKGGWETLRIGEASLPLGRKRDAVPGANDLSILGRGRPRKRVWFQGCCSLPKLGSSTDVSKGRAVKTMAVSREIKRAGQLV
jgi:hypothetical protein